MPGALTELETILQKDPVIYTQESQDIVNSPSMVEADYELHARTHMSLASTATYLDRVIRQVTENKRALVGGVTGDYGLGKTSMLIHLWSECRKQGILAVPPYQWRRFEDHLEVLRVWAKYEISMRSELLADECEAIYQEYVSTSIEDEAERITREYDIAYDEAEEIVRGQLKRGTLRLDATVDDYLNMLRDVTTVAIKAGFNGVIVFTDELQVTMDQMSPREVANILFDLSRKLRSSNWDGHYGFMVGIPLPRQAELIEVRKDIFDGLSAQRAYINLNEMYAGDFAERLWDSFADTFHFKDRIYDIVTPEALKALGQITDANRMDLGNGPRSVVSAFNRIVDRYLAGEGTYTVFDLVEDCLSGEVVLGEQSSYAQRVKEILKSPAVEGSFEEVVRLLAGFPKGCPGDFVKQHGLEADLRELSRVAYNEIVTQLPGGYTLVDLQSSVKTEIRYTERSIRSYFYRFAADAQDALRAEKAFVDHVVPVLFPVKEGHQIEGWIDPEASSRKEYGWHRDSTIDGYRVTLQGTQRSTPSYPERRAHVRVSREPRIVDVSPVDDTAHFCFDFYLDWRNGTEGRMAFVDDDYPNHVLFRLPLLREYDSFSIPGIDESSLPKQPRTPMLVLALLEHLDSDADVPQSEEQLVNWIRTTLSAQLASAVFSASELVFERQGLPGGNQGPLFVEDLFLHMCKSCFPDYHTFVTRPLWAKTVDQYINALRQESVSLSAKRGHAPYRPSDVPRDGKNRIARLFGRAKYSGFPALASDLPDLLDLSGWEDGAVRFTVHPLEQRILELVDECDPEERIERDGVLCKWVAAASTWRVAKELGYTKDEWKAALRLGLARRFFSHGKHDGQNIIFQRPISLGQLREQLLEALEQLRDVVEALGYTSLAPDVDLDDIEARIGVIQTEEDFEQIRADISLCSEGMLTRLQQTCENIEMEAREAYKRVDRSIEALTKRLTRVSGDRVAGQSPWVTELVGIHRDLCQIITNASNDCKALNRAVTDISKKATEVTGAGDLEEATRRFLSLYSRHGTFKSNVESLEARARTLSDDIDYLEKWLGVLRTSDEILTAISHAEILDPLQASALSEEYQEICTAASTYLYRQQLGNWEELDKRFEELLAEVQRFIGTYRATFNERLKDAIEFLRDVGVSGARLRTRFTENDPQGSWASLADEVTELVDRRLEQLQDSLEHLEVEFRYAGNVLNVEFSGYQQATDAIGEAAESVKHLRASTLEDSVREGSYHRFVERVAGLMDVYQEARKKLGRLIMPVEASPEAERFLELVTPGAMDLKDAILKYSEIEDLNLDKVLDLIKDLFRKNRIAVQIRRTRGE